MSELMTLSGALALPDKSKCDIHAILAGCETKPGKKGVYYRLKLQEAGGQKTWHANAFTKNSPHELVGKEVVMTKCEIGTYNDNKTITVSSFGTIGEYVGDFEAAPKPAPRPQGQAPRGNEVPLPMPQIKNGNAVHGAVVGGALARAVDIWMHLLPSAPGSYAAPKWDQSAAANVEHITRDLVAIQQRIEAGAPAPEVEESCPF